MNEDGTLNFLCDLTSNVADVFFYGEPTDCFCGKSPFRHGSTSEKVLNHIRDRAMIRKVYVLYFDGIPLSVCTTEDSLVADALRWREGCGNPDVFDCQDFVLDDRPLHCLRLVWNKEIEKYQLEYVAKRI